MTQDQQIEMIQFVKDVQAEAWSRLLDALRVALNGRWSMGAANCGVDILRAARLVGPTPWQDMQFELVTGGVYAALYAVGEIPVSMPTEDEISYTVGLFLGLRFPRDLSPAVTVPMYAPTVAAIQTPRESAYLRDGSE